MNSVLTLEHLTINLPDGSDRLYAIKDLSLTLNKHENLCIVGESGSGKSMLSNAIMGLLPERVKVSQGTINFAGKNLLNCTETQMRHIRGVRIAMIFQDPMTALNPLRTIGDQIAEMFLTHTNLSKTQAWQQAILLLSDVHISKPQVVAKAFPHELSGGQRQRAMIAMAMALDPDILIADEPTTALDVTTQAKILALIKALQQRKGTAVLFITHDFGVVAEIANKVAVIQQGVLVEQGEVDDVLNHPTHFYTQALIAAVPPLIPSHDRIISKKTILKVDNISKSYRYGGLFKSKQVTQAVQKVSFELFQGSTLGIVGESGSGKSTLARCIVRLFDIDQGKIIYQQVNIAAIKGRQLRQYSRNIQIVFQDPYASLNPRRKVGEQVATGPQLYGITRQEALQKAQTLFELVGLERSAMHRYPHEFSGGQRQRIGLARALALEPKLLIADEPVSALDVSIQEQILTLLMNLREKLGLTLLFITHDLRVAAQICDRVIVMKSGSIVEQGLASQVFLHPQQEYTQNLLAAIPGKHWNPPRMKDMSPAIHI